jgi:inner membrane protein
MPNAAAHQLGAALVIGGISVASEQQKDQKTAAPLAHSMLAASLGTLPDVLEPAYHPNHRQFFHSVVFAGLLGYGLYRLYQWEPDKEHQKVLKTLGFIAGGAFLVHLAMDATTAKSLPII